MSASINKFWTDDRLDEALVMFRQHRSYKPLLKHFNASRARISQVMMYAVFREAYLADMRVQLPREEAVKRLAAIRRGEYPPPPIVRPPVTPLIPLPPETSVNELWISTRAESALKFTNCKTVGDIRALGEEELYRMPNLGKKSIAELAIAMGGWWNPGEEPHPIPVGPDLPVEALELSARSLNILRDAGCKTIADIRALGPSGLLRLPNCGKKSIAEIEEAIGGWKAWQLVVTAYGAHVMPVDDLRPHLANTTCWCGPRQEDDEDDLVLIIHDALDRRQEYERPQ